MKSKECFSLIFIFILTLCFAYLALSTFAVKDGEPNMNIYSFSVRSIDGKEVSLSRYRGNVVLIVNTASRCGFTGQYKDLENLYKRYKNQGFMVLGFPANDFFNQEPGSNTEIKQFCSINYGVTFDLFSKIKVKGKDINPLYDYLTHHKEFGGKITWNFNKFLIDRQGNVVGRFGTRINPMSDKIIKTVEKFL